MKSKKSLLSFAFVLALSLLSYTSYSQSSVFKINIFSPLVRTLNVSFEQKLSGSSSAQLGFFYTGFSVSDTKFSGIGLTPEYRFYLSDTDAPAGVYVAPFIRYQNFKLEDEVNNAKGELSTFGGGLLIGKQWIFKERVSLDLFIGPAFQSGDVKVTSSSGNADFETGLFDGFTVRTGVTLGIAF